MKSDVDNEVLQDDELFEKSFNDAMGDLHKSLGFNEDEDLFKSKSEIVDEDEDEPEEEEDGEAGDGDGDEDDMKKSIEDYLREDPEAAAAMDVEPFLLQMVKALDESNVALREELSQTTSLVKSIGQAVYQTAQLQKSTSDMVKSIGGQPNPTKSIHSFGKSRFEGNEAPVENKDVLMKSRNWIQSGKIDLMDAGKIESRINKGTLGKVGDALDSKIQALLKEEG